MIPETFQKAAIRCLQYNVPFAVFSYPGESWQWRCCHQQSLRMVDDLNSWPEDNAFYISEFDNDSLTVIVDEMTADDVISQNLEPSLQGSTHILRNTSTPYMHYHAAIKLAKNWIGRSKRKKVVLARIEAFRSCRSIVDIACDYFDKFPETMRYLYFTPRNGVWIGASPELLLSWDRQNNTYTSMALAGTRLHSDDDWDDKNIREQDIVRTHVESVMSSLIPMRSNIVKSSTSTLRFGDIDHICTLLSSSMNDSVVSPLNVAARLSPTPAISGFPEVEAVRLIKDLEPNPRYCYGGFIGSTSTDGARFYVNLRCAAISDESTDGYRLFNVYSGSGITSMSTPQDEWVETARKMDILCHCIDANYHPRRDEQTIRLK